MIVDALTREAGAIFVAAFVILLVTNEVTRQLRPDVRRGLLRLTHPVGLALLALFVVVVVVRFVRLS